MLLPRHDYLGLFWRDMRQEDATPESRSQALQLSQAEGLDVLRHHPFFEVSWPSTGVHGGHPCFSNPVFSFLCLPPVSYGCLECCRHYPARHVQPESNLVFSFSFPSCFFRLPRVLPSYPMSIFNQTLRCTSTHAGGIGNRARPCTTRN